MTLVNSHTCYLHSGVLAVERWLFAGSVYLISLWAASCVLGLPPATVAILTMTVAPVETLNNV